jgi:hypothetical protein
VIFKLTVLGGVVTATLVQPVNGRSTGACPRAATTRTTEILSIGLADLVLRRRETPGTIAGNPPAHNGVFGTASLQKIDFPRKTPRGKNTSPLKLFSIPAPSAEKYWG